MNKDLIKQQLQANRDNPLNVKEVIETVEVGTPIRIAKDGIEFYPHMVVIRHEESGKCAVVQYRGKLPKKFDLSGNNTSNVSKSILISKASADIIEDAIDTWFNYLHYHVNAYQFVLVYCLTRGLDLIETGIIDL